MSAPIIEVDYDKLAKVALNFQQQGDRVKSLYNTLREAEDRLKTGGWLGDNATAFYMSMDSEVMVAVTNLNNALNKGADTVQLIGRTMRAGELAAADQIRLSMNQSQATADKFAAYVDHSKGTGNELVARQMQLLNTYSMANLSKIDPNNTSGNFIPDMLANVARRVNLNDHPGAGPGDSTAAKLWSETFGATNDRGNYHMQAELGPAMSDEIRKRVIDPATGHLYPDYQVRLDAIRASHENFFKYAVEPGFETLKQEGVASTPGAYLAVNPYTQGSFLGSVPNRARELREDIINDILVEQGVKHWMPFRDNVLLP